VYSPLPSNARTSDVVNMLPPSDNNVCVDVAVDVDVQTHSELFVCVYCKHTFKSQYCYQKHAKRHLNPLSLDKKLALEAPHGGSNNRDNSNAVEMLAATGVTAVAVGATATATVGATAVASAAATVASGGVDATLSAAALLRREVRPLDMNVQYYPCKTCGSKFPSYYFVHKHRKLCHADELEATTATATTTSSSSNSNSSGASKREATMATATATATEATP